MSYVAKAVIEVDVMLGDPEASDDEIEEQISSAVSRALASPSVEHQLHDLLAERVGLLGLFRVEITTAKFRRR